MSPDKRSSDRFSLVLNVLLVLGVGAAVVAWRRARNPARMWAQALETRHQHDVEIPLRRCFGGTTGADVRRLADTVHHGPLPQPFRDCHSGPMAELLVAPNAFVDALRNPPLQVYHVRERHRAALMRMGASLRVLEHEVAIAGATPSDTQREALAHRLEETATDVENERTACQDLVSAAKDSAGWL